MASAPRHLRIFLASPGDVLDEREIALAVLADLPYDPLLRGRITVEHVAWDKRGAGAPILAGVTPQDSIAEGLPLPGECDVVVVIFWSRMGTPLPESYVKADGGRYESGTEWEFENAVGAFRDHGSPYVLLYRRTQRVLLDADAPDFDDRRLQYEKVRQFFSDSAIGGYTPYDVPGDFRERLEHDLKSLVARILERPQQTSRASVALPEPWQGSPFPGLRAFTAADAPIFFGREREIDALVARITAHLFVAVVGASGSGKSSLVAAGVIPRLQLLAGSAGLEQWLTLQLTPDRLGTGDPFASLAAAVLHALPQTQQKGLATKLREEPELLASILPPRSLVFVDQFEELFTTIHPTLRAPFVDVLQRVRVILTVRADFYGHCVEMPALARLVESSTFPLAAPGMAALYEMITKPAARAALAFEEGLPQRILDDTGQEPGALALMAYALDELHRRGLTHAAYEDLGGVQGAIGKRSESVFSVHGEEERAALPAVFRELVDVDERGTATRQRANLSRFATASAAHRLIDAFTDARLLVQSSGEDNKPVVEVAHEALFRSWSRLADWISEAADDLRLLRQVRTAAVEWDRYGRRDDFLWSHERLAPVYAMRDRIDLKFDDPVAQFVRPEYERLGERIQTDPREFRQRSYVERLIEIGSAAAGVLVQSLRYASTETTRRDISVALAELGPAAVPHLVDACTADEFPNREAAVDALMLMKISPGTTVLRRLLAVEVSSVRAAAICLAATAADAAIVSSLVRCFDDDDHDVGVLAVLAIATFDDDLARRSLASAIGHPRLEHTAFHIVRHLVLGDRSDEVLSQFWNESKKTLGERLLLLIKKNPPVVLGAGKTEVLAVAVASILSSGVFTTVVELLIGMGNAPALRALLNTTPTALPLEVLLPIIKRTARPEMMAALTRLLSESQPFIRQRAADVVRCLFESGDQFESLVHALHEQDVVSALLRLANDDHVEASHSALSALSVMRATVARQVFSEHLASPHDHVRRVAIEGLGRIGELPAVPLLVASLRDPARGVQLAAAVALLELGAEKEASHEALAALDAIADSAQDGDLKAALIGLAAVSPSLDLTKVLRRVRRSKSRRARRTAGKILAELVD